MPLVQEHPDYRLVYFGSSPIPLAVHLGFLISTWQQVEVIPHHHALRAWNWGSGVGASPALLAPVHLPQERDRTPGEAVIRVSTSHVVDAAVTRRVIANPLVEVDIRLEHPSEDAFTRQDEMQEVANAFRATMDMLGDKFPGVRRVHLFASVQPGMALLLGAQISPTMHLPVQTYQYARNADGAAYHVRAVLVNGPPKPEPLPLTPEQEAQAQRDREHLAEDLDRMKGLAANLGAPEAQAWVSRLIPGPDVHSAFARSWLHLPALQETGVLETEIDTQTRSVEDSFRLEPSQKVWQLDDHWLARLAKRLPDDKERQRALRMLILHELAHRGPQMLTSYTSPGVGRFPKVLEEIDYHADVWAMLHEYALSKSQSPRAVSDVRRFFTGLVRCATSAMWAFDDAGPPPHEIQVRRLNRYLIWAWQSLLLDRGAGGGRETTLDTVLSILAHRPTIELAGPELCTREERIFFSLETSNLSVPELAIYHDGRFHRHGSRADFSIQKLLARFEARDSEGLVSDLRPAFEQTVR